MARGNNLLVLALLAGGVWLGLKGKLGEQVQMSLGQAFASLFPKDKGCSNPLPNGLVKYCEATCNVNIGKQMLIWKAERIANFENPNDWSAFVKHIAAMGNVPKITSSQPFSEFCENKAITCTRTPEAAGGRCLSAWPPAGSSSPGDGLPTWSPLPWV